MERRGGGGINRLAEIVEPAMTVGSNILAEIPAWAAGMAELNQTGLPSEGMRRLEEVSEMLTYSPRTMEGQAGLQSLTDAVMKRMDALGVDEAIKYLNNTIVPNLQKTFGEEGAREIGSSVMMAIPFVRKVPSMKAFHGSPHDFDEFSLDAIGTGEGAQAYGRGLYFAESEDVARGYRDKLTDKFNPADPDSTAATYVNDYDTSDAEAFLEQIDIDVIGTDTDLVNHRTFYEMGDGSKIIHNFETDSFEAAGDTSGRIYKVDIDASPDELLDWDLPLSEQTKAVQSVYRKQNPFTLEDDALLEALGNPAPIDGAAGFGDITGGQLYRDLTRQAGDRWSAQVKKINEELSALSKEMNDISPAYRQPPLGMKDQFQALADKYDSLMSEKLSLQSNHWGSAADVLMSDGIKGVRYKDGFSRGADGGTSNYVIFDDRLISIAKKYGIAIPAAAALLSQETGLNPSSLYEEENPV